MAGKVRCVVMIAAASCTLLAVSRVQAYEVNAKRSKVTITSVKDFVRCQNELAESVCLDGLSAYVKSHPAEAFAAGKQVRLLFNHWVALRFFAPAMGKATAEQCADEDLSLAVVSGLALPDDDPNYKTALKIAGGRCWSALEPTLVKQLDSANTYYRNHACALFKEKGASATECGTSAAAAIPEEPKPQAAPISSGLPSALLSKKTFPVEPNTTLQFRGAEEEEVLFARAKADRDDIVLLKPKNVRGPWNNKVFSAIEVKQFRGKDYVANINGSDWIIMTLRDGSYEIHLKGYKDGIRLHRKALAEQLTVADRAQLVKELGASGDE